MRSLFSILVREKVRRVKRFCAQKPVLLVGIVVSVIYAGYCYRNSLSELQQVFLQVDKYAYVHILVMLYLILKILNPTQGIVIDYQLIQLKVISLKQYKPLLGGKLWFASVFLLGMGCIFDNSFYIEVAFLNAGVNLWIFLRNRFGSRWIDFMIAVLVIIIMKWSLWGAACMFTAVFQILFWRIQKLNYEEILPIYKTTYLIGQRFSGVAFRPSEESGIQKVAESLTGKAKQKHTEWCLRYYDNDFAFYLHKELARVVANKDKLISYLLISLVISVCGLYLPEWFWGIAIVINVVIVFNYNCSMYENESVLFRRGYVCRQELFLNLFCKFVVCCVIDFVMCATLAIGKIALLLFAIVAAVVCTIAALAKCFKSV